MSNNNTTNTDSSDPTEENSNSFMVNPTPPEEGAESDIEVEPASINSYKSFVGTGMTELMPEEGPPELKGEIVFVNGYLSGIVNNSEQTWNNAKHDINPDHPHQEGYMQGESANEHNRADPDDIFTNEELEAQLPDNKRSPDQIDEAIDDGFWSSWTSYNNDVSKLWNYWNKKSNKFDAGDKYGRYFNAYRSDHYINGSHGLESNGAHRIDHGIALGYNWALVNWDIRPEEEVTENKEQSPYVESYSPPYRPVSVVAHSHGAAVGAGVALGIMRYADELGWDQMALNMIFLGVYQPQGLSGTEYDEFIYDKVNYYEVGQDFLDPFGEETSGKLLNKLAELFSRKHNKLLQRRGMVEHLREITGSWGDFAGRAVQFTFGNDRADLVTRDGDIPDISSACNPTGDSGLFCAEYVIPDDAPMSYTEGAPSQQPLFTDSEGTLELSTYIANRRFEFGGWDLFKSDEEKKFGDEWGDFEKVALAWGEAFETYKAEKNAYESLTGNSYNYIDSLNYQGVAPDIADQHRATTRAYQDMLERYAWLQDAQLYAHFGPVALIHHPRVLSDFPSDSLGKASIWERIKKAGENMFYRVEYGEYEDKGDKLGSSKRKTAKTYVEGDGKEQLVATSIANTPCIKNVIDVFVHGNKEKENLEKLYTEPGEHYE